MNEQFIKLKETSALPLVKKVKEEKGSTWDLGTLGEMWKTDSRIDIDHLHEEALAVPHLHQKYLEIQANLKFLKIKTKEEYDICKKRRYYFYSGKADPEEYADGELTYRIRDKEGMSIHLNADKELNLLIKKMAFYDLLIDYLQDILKMIHNRGFQIKNSIDYQKFQAGLGL